MILEYIVRGIIIGLLSSIPLGPIGVLCIQRTINKGQKSGFVSGLGAATADTIFAAIAGFSLSFIINFIKEQEEIIQIVGGIIIIFVGIKIFYNNPVKQLKRNKRKKNKVIEDFISVFFLTLSNPLTLFFILPIFATVGGIEEKNDLTLTILVLAGVFIGASLWWFSLTWSVNRFRKKFRLKQLWWINKSTGLIITLLGVAAVIEALLFK